MDLYQLYFKTLPIEKTYHDTSTHKISDFSEKIRSQKTGVMISPPNVIFLEKHLNFNRKGRWKFCLWRLLLRWAITVQERISALRITGPCEGFGCV